MLARATLLSFILTSSVVSLAQTTDLLFSEYIEGSSNNKYIEIYNGTGVNVNLANYAVRIYSNGTGAPSATINLVGTLANGAVYVIAHSSATIFTGTINLSSVSLSFNGDDAVELYNTSTSLMVDLIGNIGCDPGAQWTGGGNSTLDKTIVRDPDVCSGITLDNGTSCPFPTLAAEWAQFNIDDVSNLGSHNNTCTVSCTPDAQPTTNSSSLSFPDTTCSSIDLSWTSGNGTNRMVVASLTPIVGTPIDQTNYTANSTFGLGNTIAVGEYVIYNNNGNSVTVTNLTASTTYYFAIFEYNGTTANCTENYLTTSHLTGSFTTPSCPISACNEISGILVDACGGAVEGINEFFTFSTGTSSLSIDSLKVNFPSGGSFCNSGCATQTWTTNSSYVGSLNTTAGCAGLFVEVNPIPANANVIVFTGSSPTYNFDFSGLCGTGPYYAVFANNTNVGGRFANYAACATRTMTVEFGYACKDTVSYDRCLLSNSDGAYVSYDNAGNPTYDNDGCTPIQILPISLLNFSGKNISNSNLLEWATSHEVNNQLFTVERSVNAIDFNIIGQLLGAGNSNSTIYYDYVDETPLNGINYYRLKQTDYNGNFSYSKIISIVNNSSDYEIWNSSTSIQIISTNKNTQKILLVYDLMGNLIVKKSFLESTEINKSSCSSGIYLFRIIDSEKLFTQKVKF